MVSIVIILISFFFNNLLGSHFHDQNNKRKFVSGNIEDDNGNKGTK